VAGEVIVERRRRWTPEQKAALIAEVEAQGGQVSMVARRYARSAPNVSRWQRCAIQIGTLTYGSVRSILDNKLDRQAAHQPPTEAASGACRKVFLSPICSGIALCRTHAVAT
jgi:transposase-like protein